LRTEIATNVTVNLSASVVLSLKTSLEEIGTTVIFNHNAAGLLVILKQRFFRFINKVKGHFSLTSCVANISIIYL